MADVPVGGTPREWLTRPRPGGGSGGSPQLADLIDLYADQRGIPRQFVYDLVWRENGWGGRGNEYLRVTRSSAGAEGPFQMLPATNRAYGGGTDLESNVRNGISYLSDLGWNRGYGASQFLQGERSAWDPAAAAGSYIAGPNRYVRFINGENVSGFGPDSKAYVFEVTRNTVPWEQLPQRFQDLPIAQFYRGPHGSGDLGVNIDLMRQQFSPALNYDPSLGFFLDPTMLRQQPGILSPNAGSVLQGLDILPLDWGWDPTSNTWQNAPGAGSNWTLEQVPSVAGGFNLQLWDAPGAGIQYRPGGIGSDANFPSGDPFAGNDPWPILQGGGGGANVATGGIDLAHGLAQWFGGISRPGGVEYMPSGESYSGDPRGIFDSTQLDYSGDPRGLFGDRAWMQSPAWYSGDPRDLAFWSGTPGQSELTHIWDQNIGGLRTWDASLLNAPGVVSPGLGGYLQSLNVFSPNMGYNPVNDVWQNAPPAPGWQLMDVNQYSQQAIPQLQQYFQSLFPNEDFTGAFEGIGGFNQPNAVMNWVPPAPAGQQYAPGGFGYMGLPPPGTYSGPGVGALPPPGTHIFDPSAEGSGLGYQGSHGLTTTGDPALANAIAQTQLANYYANMSAIASLGPVAASPGPVLYGNPQFSGSFPIQPATNSGQVFAASPFGPATNSGQVFAVSGGPVF